MASLTNLKRQEVEISNLISFYQTAYQEAELNYQNAKIVGNTYAANIAEIDMESAKSQWDKYSVQQQDVSKQRAFLLSKCRIKDPNAQGATGKSSTSVKKVACTSGEKSQLRLLASQYSTAQNLVRIDDANYGKFKELRSAAASNGNIQVAAKYEIELGKLNVKIQQDRTSANLIRTQFSQLNSGCLNSGVSIESEYRIKYYP